MSRDYEAEVYDAVSGYAKSRHPTLHTSSWPEPAQVEYPLATIVQTDDYDVRRTLTSGHTNEARHLTYEVNVYSALPSGRKQEAKAISRTIADRFKALGFVRTAGGQPLDLTDESQRAVARYLSRFEAEVQNDETHTT